MCESDQKIDREDRRAARAHKRKRNSDYGNEPEAHPKVFKRLENYHSRNSAADKLTHEIARGVGYPDQADGKNDKRQHDEHSAEKSELFAHGREDKVGVRRGQILVYAARLESSAPHSAVRDRIAAHKRLHSDAVGIKLGLKAENYAVLLVDSQKLPQKWESDKQKCRRTDEIPPRESCAEEHYHDYAKVHKCNSEVSREQNESDDHERVQTEEKQAFRSVQLLFDKLDVLCEGADEGDFDKLGRLNCDIDERYSYPASVCGLDVLSRATEKQGEREQDDRHQKHYYGKAVNEKSVIHVRDNKECDRSCECHRDLHLELALTEVIDRAVDRDYTDKREDSGTAKKYRIDVL